MTLQMTSMLSGFKSLKWRDNVKGPRWVGTRVPEPQYSAWKPMLNAGIVLGDDVCQLMLLRYGGPRLQIDFVSFVHLMLRAVNMESK